MMQMEWCNQFDSSIRIHRREEEGRGREETREDCHCALMSVSAFIYTSYTSIFTFKSVMKNTESEIS